MDRFAPSFFIAVGAVEVGICNKFSVDIWGVCIQYSVGGQNLPVPIHKASRG